MHSNFITPPDFVETVLVLNATEDQIKELGTLVQGCNVPYNVYFYNDAMNDVEWVQRVSKIADKILDVNLINPLEYFNK